MRTAPYFTAPFLNVEQPNKFVYHGLRLYLYRIYASRRWWPKGDILFRESHARSTLLRFPRRASCASVLRVGISRPFAPNTYIIYLSFICNALFSIPAVPRVN